MKILIIEDDPISLGNMKDMIESQGHEVATATNGKSGLDTFGKFAPDLVFTDIQMPEMDGLQVLKEIRSKDHQTIVIVSTAFGSEKFSTDALRLKANNYLNKPVHFSEITYLLKKFETVIKNRILQPDIDAIISIQSFSMSIPSNTSQVDKVANYLLSIAANFIRPEDRMGIRLGLVELLTNSIEHGNLEVTDVEKAEANDNFNLQTLLQKRLADKRLADRRVKIDFEQTEEQCEWLITDEGAGFDWKNLPDPNDPANLLASHGKGILLSSFQFDKLEYQGTGNSVRIVKSRKNQPENENE